MAFDWFTLHDIQPIDGFLVRDRGGAPWVADWDAWRFGFVVGVTIEGNRTYSFRVDALPLLYELRSAITDLAAHGSFRAEFGDEGIVMSGTSEPQGVTITIGLDDNSTAHVMAVHRLSVSDASLFLTMKSTELSKHLEKTGINLERLLSEYPLQEASIHY